MNLYTFFLILFEDSESPPQVRDFSTNSDEEFVELNTRLNNSKVGFITENYSDVSFEMVFIFRNKRNVLQTPLNLYQLRPMES